MGRKIFFSINTKQNQKDHTYETTEYEDISAITTQLLHIRNQVPGIAACQRKNSEPLF